MSRIAIIGIVGQSVFLSVDSFHRGGETVVAKDLHVEWGGKGYNQAIAAARHGAEVSFLAAVCETDAESVRADAEARGIDAHLATGTEGSPYAVIMTDAEGANHVTVFRGASLTPRDVADFRDEIARADLLLLTNEVPEKVNESAIRIAQEHGVRVVLNPAPARPLSAEILSGVSLFTPNEHETAGLEELSCVVVTLGDRGCLVRESGRQIPAVKAGATVDTTGAGDSFMGGFLYNLIKDKKHPSELTLEDIEKYGNFAGKVAAYCVGKRGAIDAMPALDEIK